MVVDDLAAARPSPARGAAGSARAPAPARAHARRTQAGYRAADGHLGDLASTDASDADTIAVGIFDGDEAPPDAPAEVAELLASGEARSTFKALALAHADGRRWLLVGLGARRELTPERARVAAAAAGARAREISTRTLCWAAPGDGAPTAAAALVEGTLLGDYRFELHKSARGDDRDAPRRLERLLVAGGAEIAQSVADAALVAAAANRARDLQNRPGNDLTPTALGEYARALGERSSTLSVEVEGRAGHPRARHGRLRGRRTGLRAGAGADHAALRRRRGADGAPVLGLVGKAVTFDSGGISLKPGAKMAEMKFDMSGGAAVIEAIAAIAAPAPARASGRRGRRHREPPQRALGQARRHRHGRQRQRRSRSTTPTPRDAWCWPTACGTRSHRAPSGS